LHDSRESYLTSCSCCHAGAWPDRVYVCHLHQHQVPGISTSTPQAVLHIHQPPARRLYSVRLLESRCVQQVRRLQHRFVAHRGLRSLGPAGAQGQAVPACGEARVLSKGRRPGQGADRCFRTQQRKTARIWPLVHPLWNRYTHTRDVLSTVETMRYTHGSVRSTGHESGRVQGLTERGPVQASVLV
jgi:hypothetical protein